MRKLLAIAAGAALAAALAAPIFAAGLSAEASAEADMTVKGEVVDIACALKGDKGEAHAACTLSCAKRGQPVGILTADAMYEVTGDFAANKNAKLIDFVAKQVEVTGAVSEKDGKKLLEVKSIKLAK